MQINGKRSFQKIRKETAGEYEGRPYGRYMKLGVGNALYAFRRHSAVYGLPKVAPTGRGNGGRPMTAPTVVVSNSV